MELFVDVYLAYAIISGLIYALYFFDNYDSCRESVLEYYGLVSKYLYENTDMNILGCIIVAQLYYLFIPIIFVPKLCIIFVYWLCHVGRKKGE